MVYTVRIQPNPEDVKRQADEDRYKQEQLNAAKSLNRISALGTAVAFLALLALAWYACLTSQQLEHSKQASRLDERAWVTVQSIPVPAKITDAVAIGVTPNFRMFIENSGRTPAVETLVAGSIIVRENLSQDDLSDRTIGAPGSRMIIGPNMTPPFIVLTCDQAFTTQPQIDAFTQGTTRMYAIGIIYYNDIFDRPHKTRFCFSVGAKDWIYGMTACKEHNDVDQEWDK
jgi:hypothetical protein